MPGLVPGIHVLATLSEKGVDGRDKPGHDEKANHFQVIRKSPLLLASLVQFNRIMTWSLAHVLQRTDHRVDHAAGQKIDRGFAAELIARAAFDQARSETALYRCDDVGTAGLGPD